MKKGGINIGDRKTSHMQSKAQSDDISNNPITLVLMVRVWIVTQLGGFAYAAHCAEGENAETMAHASGDSKVTLKSRTYSL